MHRSPLVAQASLRVVYGSPGSANFCLMAATLVGQGTPSRGKAEPHADMMVVAVVDQSRVVELVIGVVFRTVPR